MRIELHNLKVMYNSILFKEYTVLRNLVASLSVLCMVWLASPVDAALLLVRGDASTSLTLTNTTDFAGSGSHSHRVVNYVPSFLGDSGFMTFTFSSAGAANVAVSGDVHTQISGITVSPLQVTFTATSRDGQPGRYSVDWDRTVNIGTPLTTGVSNGHYFLQYQQNPTLTLVPGSPFTLRVSIPGDWSVSGNDTSEHQLLSLNPLWTIDQNFFFDGTSTIFAAHIDSYVFDGAHDPNLVYRLIGAVVPLPATWLLFCIAICAMVIARRTWA